MADTMSVVAILKRTAHEIRQRSIAGWGNTIDEAITALESQQSRIAELKAALTALKHKNHNGCWCQMSIGNPMLPSHTDACKLAMVAMMGPQPPEGGVSDE